MTDARLRRKVMSLERQVAELTERLNAQRGPCRVNISASSVDLDEIIQVVARNNPRAADDRPPDTPAP